MPPSAQPNPHPLLPPSGPDPPCLGAALPAGEGDSWRDLMRLLAEAKPAEVAAICHFARALRQGLTGPQPAVAGGSSPAVAGRRDYLIQQESTRRRAGMQDRTQVSTWRFWFRGEEMLMPPWVGTEYLVFLMRNQGKEFDASALTQAIRKNMVAATAVSGLAVSEILYGQGDGDDGEPAGGRVGDLNNRDVIWDEHQIAEAMRLITVLQGEIRLHEAAGDFCSEGYQVLKTRLEEQQELLEGNAKNMKGKWVPKEYQKGTFQEKADLIRRHVRKLLDGYLRENCRPLFDHLNDRTTLVYGVNNAYHPKPRIEWEFQFKEGKTGT